MKTLMLILTCVGLSLTVMAQDEDSQSDESGESESIEATDDPKDSSQEAVNKSERTEVATKESDNKSARTTKPEIFKPTEDISEDYAVPFPVDI